MIIDYDPVSGGGGEMVDRLMDHQMFSRLLSTSTAIIPVTIVLCEFLFIPCVCVCPFVRVFKCSKYGRGLSNPPGK